VVRLGAPDADLRLAAARTGGGDGDAGEQQQRIGSVRQVERPQRPLLDRCRCRRRLRLRHRLARTGDDDRLRRRRFRRRCFGRCKRCDKN
jgi:hypothetical protein